MKKLVFAAVAALAMVSVSNVFAGKSATTVSVTAPTDTVTPATPDTLAPVTPDTLLAPNDTTVFQ